MAMNINDYVQAPMWDSSKGPYIESYKVLEVNDGVLKLEHTSTSYPGGVTVTGSLNVFERAKSEFEVPLDQRFKVIMNDVNEMLKQLAN